MAEVTVTVLLQDIHAVPDPVKAVLHLGDFVTYTSPDGDLEVLFSENGSPFNRVSVRGGERVEAINEGEGFICKCFITKDNVTRGWDAVTSPQSGGDHDVRP